mgnify:CR=1 FL=1
MQKVGGSKDAGRNPTAQRLRQAVRAVILDPDDHILLVRFRWSRQPSANGLWATPGGGIEAGETHLEALRREMHEETGMPVAELGPLLWTRTAHRAFSGWTGQTDHVYLFRTERFDPTPALTPAQLRDEGVQEVRWLSPPRSRHRTRSSLRARSPDCSPGSVQRDLLRSRSASRSSDRGGGLRPAVPGAASPEANAGSRHRAPVPQMPGEPRRGLGPAPHQPVSVCSPPP